MKKMSLERKVTISLLPVIALVLLGLFLYEQGVFFRLTPGGRIEILLQGTSSPFSSEYSSLKVCNPNSFALECVLLDLNDGRWSCDVGTIEAYGSAKVEPSDFSSKAKSSKRLESFEKQYKLEIWARTPQGRGRWEFLLSELRTP